MVCPSAAKSIQPEPVLSTGTENAFGAKVYRPNVTLAGFVRSFRQRRKAEQDVKRVAGVVGMVNNIEVRLPIIHRRPDPDIALDAAEAIKRELPFSTTQKSPCRLSLVC